MTLPSYQIPIIGNPSASEDPKIHDALQQIFTILSGQIDSSNIADGSLAAGDLAQLPQARVTNSVAVAIPDSAWTTLSFDTDRWNIGSVHSTATNPSRLTAPANGGYLAGVAVNFAVDAVGARGVRFRLNGTTDLDELVTASAGNTAASSLSLPLDYRLTAGDYLEVQVFQSSGAPLNVNAGANFSPEAWLRQVGP